MSLDALFASLEPSGQLYLDAADGTALRETIDTVSMQLANSQHTEALAALDAAGIDDSEAGRLLRAACFVADEKIDQAIELFGDIDSRDMLFLYTRGILLHRQDKLRQASEYFYLASQAETFNEADIYFSGRSLMYLAIELGSQGRLRGAADAWQRYDSRVQAQGITDLSIADDSEYYARWGEVLFDLGDCQEACGVLDVAFRFDKSNADVPPMLIESLLACGDFSRARDVALEMLAGPTNKGACTELLLKLFKTTGEVGGPEAMLADLTRTGLMVDETVLLSLSRSAWLLGERESAIAMLGDNLEAMEYPHLVAGSLYRWLLLVDRPMEALEVICRSLKQNPDCSDQLSRLLDSAYANAFTSELLDGFIASGDSENDPVRLFVAALAAKRFGDDEKTLELLKKSCPLDGTELFKPAVAAYCQQMAASGDVNVFNEYASVYKDSKDLWFVRYLYGAQMAASKSTDQAIKLLDMSLQDNPEFDSTRIMLAELQFGDEKYSDAMRTLSPTLRQYRQLDYAVKLSSYYEHLSRYYQGRKDSRQAAIYARHSQMVLADVLEIDPAHPGAITALLVQGGSSANFIESNMMAQRLYDLGCRDAGFLYVKVLVQTRLGTLGVLPAGRYEKAVADLNEAIKISGRTHQLVSLLAELHSTAGHYELSAQEYIRMRDEDHFAGPDGYSLRAAMQYAIAGKKDMALQQFGKIYGKLPNVTIKYLKFSLDPKLEDIEILFGDKAETKFWRDICYDQLRGNNESKLIDIFNSEHDFNARDEYGSAIIATGDNYARFALKWLTSQKSAYWLKRCKTGQTIANGRLEALMRGMNMRQRFLSQNVLGSHTPVDLAVSRMIEEGKLTDAVSYVQAICDEISALNDRDSIELCDYIKLHLLSSLRFTNEKALAADLVELYLSDRGDSLVLLTEALSILPTHTRMYNKCRARALELSPLDSRLNNNLAYEWLNRGINLDKCSDMLYRAMSFDSGTHIIDSLGWLMYKRNWLPRARRQLESAVNAPDGDSSVIYDHLGDVYWRLGHSQSALEMWRQAVDLCETDRILYPEILDADSMNVGQRAAEKIRAAEAGQEVPVSPLGKGVK